jgi:hypothetical protein
MVFAGQESVQGHGVGGQGHILVGQDLVPRGHQSVANPDPEVGTSSFYCWLQILAFKCEAQLHDACSVA